MGESVDNIRALLLSQAEGRQTGQLLMVTSAVAREGKTTLASHLAVSLAWAGRRTLLIDGDFRRPRLHRVFNLPPGPGLSDVLRGDLGIEAAGRPGPVDGLTVLTAGQDAHLCDQTRGMDQMRDLFERLRSQYDFILVDSSPVLPVADALVLGKRMDAVLLSVRPEVSQVPLVYAACARLAALRIPVMGAVVNGVRKSMTGYDYQYLVESQA